MSTLYRQYRPQRFKDVHGQPQVIGTLEQAIAKQKIAHAYLFCGPRGTGKTTTARLLAKRLNCTGAKENETEPCTACEQCIACQNNSHLDVIEIDAASNRGIDDIRLLRDAAILRPSMGKYKVYIIDEVHMLTAEAFAALLKTLEEPREHIVFILATTEQHKVPATIASRCQVYRFRRATPTEMKERLRSILKQEKRKADDSVLDIIISRADGCYRDGESLLGQLLTAHSGQLTSDKALETLGLPSPAVLDTFLSALIAGESNPALDAVDQSFSQGFDPEHFLKESIRLSRDGALQLLKGSSDIPAFARLPRAGERLPLIIRTLLQALQDIAYVPQPLIAVQLAVLTLCTKKGAEPMPVVKTDTAPVAATTKTILRSTPQPSPQPVQATVSNGAVSVDHVRSLWPQVIQKLREHKDPVASTFLRAIEPVSVDDNKLTLRANYALHRNFFDKPDKKKLVEQCIAEVIGTKLTVHCVMADMIAKSGAAEASQPQTDLYEAAKELFSQPVQQ